MSCPGPQLQCVQDDSKPPQCCLCPIEGGALKPTTEPGLWCHATCLQWIPEVSVGDDRRMEPVTHIRSIQKERWELNCCICKSVTSLLHVCPAARVSVLASMTVCTEDTEAKTSSVQRHCTSAMPSDGMSKLRQAAASSKNCPDQGLTLLLPLEGP